MNTTGVLTSHGSSRRLKLSIMHRSAARRILPAICRRTAHTTTQGSSNFSVPFIYKSTFATGHGSENASDFKTDHFDSSISSSSTEGSKRGGDVPSGTWKEVQERVLQASLRHVIMLGWSDAALTAGAREIGVSPSIVGSFPRKEAALVEFFMDGCLQKLIYTMDTKEDLKNHIPSQRIGKLVRIRLEMQSPYISKWPQALSIQAQPSNIPSSFKQRAMLVDEIWHAAGDESTDIDWYVKRTILGGIYSTTELYMLTDTSIDFEDTWAFLDERVRDAFDLNKSFQEAKYLAEAVGAGMGGSVEGFMRKFSGLRV